MNVHMINTVASEIMDENILILMTVICTDWKHIYFYRVSLFTLVNHYDFNLCLNSDTIAAYDFCKHFGKHRHFLENFHMLTLMFSKTFATDIISQRLDEHLDFSLQMYRLMSTLSHTQQICSRQLRKHNG